MRLTFRAPRHVLRHGRSSKSCPLQLQRELWRGLQVDLGARGTISLASKIEGSTLMLPDDPARADQRDILMSDDASHEAAPDRGEVKGITTREIVDIEERAQPRTPVIYEVVRRMGEEELARPTVSLWWSGVAAGLSMSFSLLAQAVLQTHLSEKIWTPLVVAAGYPAGFLLVVLSRQQLFTENTITAVLPLFRSFTALNLGRVIRLWSVVFAANMTGALVAALFYVFTPALTAELREGAFEISRHMLSNSSSEMFFKAIPSGFLVAAMVWLAPNAESARFQTISLLTYLIAVGGFTHIVAGSVEAFLLVLTGELATWRLLGHFLMPVLLGNIIGGTVLFALISHAQVMKEI
jgi:formate/nitrite transporter FocA (FNT family)